MVVASGVGLCDLFSSEFDVVWTDKGEVFFEETSVDTKLDSKAKSNIHENLPPVHGTQLLFKQLSLSA